MMNDANKFYNDDDREQLNFSSEKKKEDDGLSESRTRFQSERDHVLFSSSFRRLQGKTQIYPIGEYDFYRNRLTHSIEVAKIGRSICNHLNREARKSNEFEENEYIDPVLVEAAGLAHDIGHPPFGHTGETALNEVMQDFGGFEGNAQNLRIITQLIDESAKGEDKGMMATRAFLDSILKYKKIFNENEKNKSKFLYKDQKDILDEITKSVSSKDKDTRSIECQIMNWADDTAYSIHDISDGIKAGFITFRKVKDWIEKAEEKIKKDSYGGCSGELQRMKANDFIIKMVDDREAFLENEMLEFIKACCLKKKAKSTNLSKRYLYELDFDCNKRINVVARCKIYKDIAKDLVYETNEINQVRHKFEVIIKELFHAFNDNSKKLLPNKIYKKIIRAEENAVPKQRIISDYISGMTDSFAIHTYKRLHDPNYGSFRDIV